MLNLKKAFGTFAMVSAVVLMSACTNTAVSPVPSNSPSPSTDIEKTVTLVITDVDFDNVEKPVDFSPSDLNDLPTTVVVDGKIVYTHAGSGSCAPVLETAVYENGSYILKEKVYPEDTPCTDDLQVVQQAVSIEGGEAIPADAMINLVTNS